MTPTWQLWPKGVIWWHQRCCQRHCFAQNVSGSSGSLWGKLLWPSKGGWRAGGVLAAFCFLSKLHRVGANFVKYWCSVYLTGKKENRCQGIICKKNATCGRYSGPRLQDFSASYQIFSLISKKRLRKALQAQFNAVAKSAASSSNFSIKIWFLDTQNTSYLIVRDLKNAFSCP